MTDHTKDRPGAPPGVVARIPDDSPRSLKTLADQTRADDGGDGDKHDDPPAAPRKAGRHAGWDLSSATAKRRRASNDVDDDGWRTSRDPSDALADEVLAAALPRDVLRKIMRGDPVAVVLAVPGPDWIAPVSDAIGALCRDADVVRRDGSSRREHVPTHGNDKVASTLRTGMPVIGVSQSPQAYLPAALVASADASVAIQSPDAGALRRVLARCACRPVPRAIPDAPCAGLSFDEVCAAFRKHATGHDVLDALARMRARKAAPIDDGTPPLDKLPGVSGEARRWAETLARDFAHWKSGQIKSFEALDSKAMIYGNPGVGKTWLVRSLARTLGVQLHYTCPGAWFCGPGNSGHLGDAAAAFRNSWDSAVAEARSGLGAVWMLDEADGLMDRASGAGSGNRDFWANLLSLINVTLNETVPGLCVIGATNAGTTAAPGSSIDAALRRRFGRTLVMGDPSATDLSEVVSYWTGGALSAADLLPVVRLTSGASAADAANWARDATNFARNAKRAVTVADVLAVAAPPDRRPADVVRRIAVHEAAHAVAAHALGRGVAFATIVETASTDGLTRMTPVGIATTATNVDQAVIRGLAGRAAEETMLGDVSAGAEGDLAQATAMLAAAHASAGLGAWLVHRAPSNDAMSLLRDDPDLRDVVEAHLAALYREALALVVRHRAAIERVADALIARRLLTGDDVRALAGDASSGGRP